jgi:polysaccharide biosynthesis protein PslH
MSSEGPPSPDVAGRRPSTLIIGPFAPYPAVFGGAQRLYAVVKMFAEFSDVTLVTYRSFNADDTSIAHLSTICAEVELVDGVPTDTTAKWKLQLRGLLDGKTFQYYAFYAKHFQAAIDRHLSRKHFDVIVVEQSQMGWFDTASNTATGGSGAAPFRIFDLQNIESELLARRAAVHPRGLRKLALMIEARRFARKERAMCRQYDLVLTPSDRETEQLRSEVPGVRFETLPNTIDTSLNRRDDPNYHPTEVTFIGTTQVEANRDGVLWFAEEILPIIRVARPDVHVSIVGGKPPPEVLALGDQPNVTVTGFVDDIHPYIQRAATIIVPLRVGGGTRLKILDAMNAETPVVSTTLGAEGIAGEDGTHLLLADEPADFAAAVLRLLDEPHTRAAMAAAGRELVEREYDWRAHGRRLQAVLHR